MSTTNRKQIPPLSKSRFLAGCQCHKRLYLECFNRNLADPISVRQQEIFDTGTEVGEIARRLYVGGLLIDEDYLHFDEAVASTNAALSDLSLPALFEAAFQYEDISIRADILKRYEDGRFDLIEFKSSTQVKVENIHDVGIQLYVLSGCGIPIRRTCIGYLNKEYVYQGGEYDLNQLFLIDDITDKAEQLQTQMPTLIGEMRKSLWCFDPPDIKPGKYCSKPHTCLFYDYCHANEPEHHVRQLPWASEKLLLSLEKADINDIGNIPAYFVGLNTLQERVRNCVINDCLYLENEIERQLKQLEYPVYFLDFEAFNPVLPLYVGTHPYQVIPFQWSIHTLDKSGELRHKQFLHEGPGDPRRLVAETLLQALGTTGSIIVYSGYEAARIRELAEVFPDLSSSLMDLLNGRIMDLLKLLRKHCYHPKFHGSFSIKSVLPALVPGLDYSDLAIDDGGMASAAYAEMRRPEILPERRDFIKQSLLAYCKRDTEAMVRLFQTLRSGTET